MQIYNAQIAAVTQRISAGIPNVTGIQVGKTGANLYPQEYPVQRSYHMSAGIQRDLGNNMVIDVEFVRRVFVNTLLGALDLQPVQPLSQQAWGQTPVIPRCTSAAQDERM